MTDNPRSPTRNWLGIAALILGVVGVISGVIPFLFWLAGIVGVAGLILGFAGRSRANRGEAPNGPIALWGIITSAVAVALSIVGLVIVVGVFGERAETVSGTFSSDVEPTGPGPTPRPVPQEVEQEPARIGEAGADGDFIFVVTAVEDGPANIEDPNFSIEPLGKFVFVTVTVTNHGDSPRSLPADNQYLIDTDGKTASADAEAAAYLPEDEQSIFVEIDPGTTLTGIAVFDIPEDATPASLELHESAFSRGVTVALG